MLTSFIGRLQDVFNLMFMGHLDNEDLIAGVGLAASTLNFIGMTIIKGLATAIDTLVSQAAGAGNMELCGVYLNRARFIMTMLFIPVSIFSFFVKDILVSVG